MAVEVYMPKMSDHMEAGEIIRWLVAEGDWVEQRQPILELATDKVVAELEAPASGVVKGIRTGVQPGAIIPVGETIAYVAAVDEAVPVLPPIALPGVRGAERVAPPSSATAGSGLTPSERSRVRATPAARAVARDLGVDLALVKGTGPDARIREEDVRAFAEARKVAARAAPLGRPKGSEEDVEWVDLTPVQRLTGQRMLESVQTAPQFTLAVRVDATNLLSARDALAERVLAETGQRLSITTLLVKVVAAALREHPRVNASLEQGRVKQYRQVNVGVAIGADRGLVVPVIREADQKSLAQITRELNGFVEKAREFRFGAMDLSGGTFTISNLGMYGVDSFTAIINPPESAILAVGRIAKTPV
ncbi:MAG: dihydrolipoamide acetyltransferase family protein, partial [Longimicrobiales bacterium]|nr:dihydrolipoamide acetyltransferase family protein [Longimicrobiales bacterium]